MSGATLHNTLLVDTPTWLENLAAALQHREADQLSEDPDWTAAGLADESFRSFSKNSRRQHQSPRRCDRDGGRQ